MAARLDQINASADPLTIFSQMQAFLESPAVQELSYYLQLGKLAQNNTLKADELINVHTQINQKIIEGYTKWFTAIDTGLSSEATNKDSALAEAKKIKSGEFGLVFLRGARNAHSFEVKTEHYTSSHPTLNQLSMFRPLVEKCLSNMQATEEEIKNLDVTREWIAHLPETSTIKSLADQYIVLFWQLLNGDSVEKS